MSDCVGAMIMGATGTRKCPMCATVWHLCPIASLDHSAAHRSAVTRSPIARPAFWPRRVVVGFWGAGLDSGWAALSQRPEIVWPFPVSRDECPAHPLMEAATTPTGLLHLVVGTCGGRFRPVEAPIAASAFANDTRQGVGRHSTRDDTWAFTAGGEQEPLDGGSDCCPPRFARSSAR
jgi:hypothetical protein